MINDSNVRKYQKTTLFDRLFLGPFQFETSKCSDWDISFALETLETLGTTLKMSFVWNLVISIDFYLLQ